MINRDEWLEALKEADDKVKDQGQDALTRSDYAKLMGISGATAGRHLRIMVENGKAERTFKWIRRADSSQVRTAAYRLKKKK